MSGWVPIPQIAIDAVGRQGRGALLDLYDRANRTGYAPRAWTERELAEEWGLDRRVVVRVLDALVRVGVLEIDRAPPGARQPSLLRVLPAVVSDVHQVRHQSLNQTRSQNQRPDTDTIRPTAPAAAPGPAPGPAPPRAEIFPRVVEEQDQEQDHSPLRGERATTSPPARTVPPAASPQDPLPLALEAQAPAEEPQPAAPKWARGHRVPPRVVVAAVVRALTAIRGDAPDLQRCATEAAHVVKLQRATMTPWEELGEQLELVARWAQESHDLLASNDIRGIDARTGNAWTADRSRNASTLCAQGIWGSRLAAAQRWKAGGSSDRPRARGEHSSARKSRPTTAEIIAADPSVLAGVFGDLEAP